MAEPKPSDFFLEEALTGNIGAAAGGGVVALVTWLAYMSCPMNDYGACGRSVLFQGVLGVPVGIVAGATIGVETDGSIHGVSGNLVGAIGLGTMGAIAGVFAGAIVGATINALLGNWPFSTVRLPPEFVFPTIGLSVCIGAGFGAGFGYNIGAKMKSEKSKPVGLSWHLPLVALRF
ncbi:hypothetical protein HYR54_04725 [Candidatus Acetothermia bacterium]|nr:hypothetical protein [Candidatus Acetothermia bacterium]